MAARFTDGLGDLLLRAPVMVGEALIGLGLFDGI